MARPSNPERVRVEDVAATLDMGDALREIAKHPESTVVGYVHVTGACVPERIGYEAVGARDYIELTIERAAGTPLEVVADLKRVEVGGRGRYRYYVCCPSCQRSTMALVIVHSWSRRVGCRVCEKLSYRTQHVGKEGRATLKATKIRRQISGRSMSLVEPFPQKPPAWPWKKYARFWAADDAALDVVFARLTREVARAKALVGPKAART